MTSASESPEPSTDSGSGDASPGDASPGDAAPRDAAPRDAAPRDAGSSEAASKLREKKADESWKERAHKEKEKLASRPGKERPRMPPASFLGLLEELAVRAMLGLGQILDPISGEASINLEGAKYAIDLLGILEAKTKGNLEPAESAAVADLLQNLRLSFVQISKNPPTPEELLAASQARSGRGDGPGPGSVPEKDGAGPKIVL